MQGIRLTAATTDMLTRLRKLYEASFPPEERRGWESITGAANDAPGPILRAIRDDDGAVCGMVTFWSFGKFTYIEHLAVDSGLRGKGIGARVLEELARACGNAIVLEVDPPENSNPMAIRRIGFYRRNGLGILCEDGTPYPYIQPPYATGLPSVPLLLMSTDITLDPREVEKVLHREVYGAC